MVAALLGADWALMWILGDDWAPWDIEHRSGAKIEIKQSAARQFWHPPKVSMWERHGSISRPDSGTRQQRADGPESP